MKTLLLMRHAKSSWKDESLADTERPLKKRGRKDAPRMGELLREQGLVPDLIVSSHARRAHRTAELVAEACGYEGEVQVSPDLYGGGPEAYWDVLARLDEPVESVLLVGHNPDIEEFLEEITGDWERLPTAALAQIALPVNSWGLLVDTTRGRLVEIWLPRHLK